MNARYECIVIGGGPAGTTAAALVAGAGRSTLLIERDAMPRFHIGESLMPETYWTFQRLGVLEQMRQSHFTKKYSVQFVSHTGKESQPFYFQEHDPRECSQTWQVLRSEFDQMLWDNAASKGAECHDKTRVIDVLFDDGRAVGVKLQGENGAPQEVACDVVIDASGLQSVLGHKLGLIEFDPHLRKAAIWGYYEGARRDQGINGGATLVLHTQSKQAWFWYIPLADDVTSVGVVGDGTYLLEKARGTPEEVFEEELVHCPAVLERLVDAHLVSKFRVAREFTYTTRQPAGDGWVFAGDALSFIDPIYSSGVFLALKSGELAADAVVEGLGEGDLSGQQLGGWMPDFKEGVRRIRKLVDAFYTEEFSFGQFMREYPQHKGNLVDLLIGRVFHSDAERIFDDMDPWLTGIRGQQDIPAQPQR